LHILYSDDRKCFHILIRRLVKHSSDANKYGKEGSWYFYCCYLFHLITNLDSQKDKNYQLSFSEMKWCIGANSQMDLFYSIYKDDDDWTWNNVRCLGLPVLVSPYALKDITQMIAKAEWKKYKNPNRCAVFYVACQKISLLAQIFRDTDIRVTKFLGEYLADPESRTILKATQENAYGLMRNHKFDLATAFFLLCGNVKAAIDIAYSRMNDWQLAILISRVMNEGNPLAFHKTISDKIIPDNQTNEEFVSFLSSILSPQPKKLLIRYEENE